MLRRGRFYLVAVTAAAVNVTAAAAVNATAAAAVNVTAAAAMLCFCSHARFASHGVIFSCLFSLSLIKR